MTSLRDQSDVDHAQAWETLRERSRANVRRAEANCARALENQSLAHSAAIMLPWRWVKWWRTDREIRAESRAIRHEARILNRLLGVGR